jgi:hypothetical protein
MDETTSHRRAEIPRRWLFVPLGSRQRGEKGSDVSMRPTPPQSYWASGHGARTRGNR